MRTRQPRDPAAPGPGRRSASAPSTSPPSHPSDPRADLTGVVLLVERLGNLTVAYVETPAGQIVLEGTGALPIRPDDAVGLILDRAHIHVFMRWRHL